MVELKLLSKPERETQIAPLIRTGWDYRYFTPLLHTPKEIGSKIIPDAHSLISFPAVVSSSFTDFHEHEHLFRVYTFADFNGAFAFMTQIALYAEKLQHHPEWHNVYDKVSIAWRTHDVGGISILDVEMAELCDQLYSKYVI